MFAGQTVFSQLIEYLPMHSFRALVRQYKGNRWVKKFSCHDQLLTLIFAQLAGCDSLRDIEVCFCAQPGQRYHLGIRGQVKRSTLSDANESRDYRIFEGYYLLDKGYIDYARLYALRISCAFFVTRVKGRMQHTVVAEKNFAPDTGVEGDAIIKLTGVESAKNYSEHLRTVKYYDREHDKHYEFLTNNFTLDALTIAQLYKQRWQVELFFKWIKQHLKIKAFFGTSENAVKVQVWTAILTYCLLAIAKKRLCLPHERAGAFPRTAAGIACGGGVGGGSRLCFARGVCAFGAVGRGLCHAPACPSGRQTFPALRVSRDEARKCA